MVYTFASCNHPFIWAFFLSTALCYTGRMMVQHIQLQPLIATVSVGTGPGKPQMLGQGFCLVPSSFSLLVFSQLPEHLPGQPVRPVLFVKTSVGSWCL